MIMRASVIAFLLISLFLFGCNQYTKITLENSVQKATFVTYSKRLSMLRSYERDTVKGKSISSGLVVRIDTSTGISIGTYETVGFEYETTANSTVEKPVMIKFGDWRYYNNKGDLDSIVKYKKVKSIAWQVDTSIVFGRNQIDSSFNIKYKTKKIYPK